MWTALSLVIENLEAVEHSTVTPVSLWSPSYQISGPLGRRLCLGDVLVLVLGSGNVWPVNELGHMCFPKYAPNISTSSFSFSFSASLNPSLSCSLSLHLSTLSSRPMSTLTSFRKVFLIVPLHGDSPLLCCLSTFVSCFIEGCHHAAGHLGAG